MTSCRWLCCLLIASCLLQWPPIHAENLIAALSKSCVEITSNYTGDHLILFGTIQRDEKEPPHGGYDLVVTVSGPQQSLVVTQKRRLLGIWLNGKSLIVENIPSYFAVMSNRAISDIASGSGSVVPEIGNRNRQDSTGNEVLPPSEHDKNFDDALTDHRLRSGLLHRGQSDIDFIAPTLFRASIPLPGNVLTGTYQVNVKAYWSGQLVGEARSEFEVRKSGLTQWTTAAAREWPLAYGFSVVALAALTGWFANRIFRRE